MDDFGLTTEGGWAILNVIANLFIMVIFPMTLFLVKWINKLRSEIQEEIRAAHQRIGQVEKSQLQFQTVVAERYMSRDTAHTIMNQQKTILETKLEGQGKQLDRIERWLTRVDGDNRGLQGHKQ